MLRDHGGGPSRIVVFRRQAVTHDQASGETDESADSHMTLASAPTLPGDGAAPAEPLPEQLGHYRLLRELGRGGMGVVHAAVDRKLDRKVAIKTLARADSPSLNERLVREAKAMAKLTHPNVVRVYEIGEAGDASFIVMEFIEGRTLREWLRERPRSLTELLEVFRAAGRGLAAIHGAGLVHRDVKPDNIMVDDGGRVVVMDLGIARRDEDQAAPSEVELAALSEGELALTRTGTVLGSPAYMAPEQFSRAAVTARVDQFGLCVALWEAVYGQRPFTGHNIVALMDAIHEGALREPEAERAPAWLRGVLERGLAADPAARFESMSALVEALTEPVEPRARWPRALGLAALGLVLVGLAWVVAGARGGDPKMREPGTQELAQISETPSSRVELGATPTPPSSREPLVLDRGALTIEVAPDGRDLVYQASGGGRLWRVDLETGEEAQMELDNPIIGVNFAPDGSLWFTRLAGPQPGVHRLATLAARPERVAAELGSTCALPGRSAFAWLGRGDRRVRVRDGEGRERVLLEPGEDQRPLELACDDVHGRLVVASQLAVGYRLELLELDGQRRRVLLEHTGELARPRFTSEGRALTYLASRGLGLQLEALSLADPRAPALLGAVLPGVQLDDYGLLADGRLVYLRNDWSWEIVEFGPDQRALGEARPRMAFAAESVGFALSPDERLLGYVESSAGMGRLQVAALAGGEPRELATALGGVDLAWSPDSRRIAYVGQHRGEGRIWTVVLDGESPRVYESTRVAPGSSPIWVAGERIIYERTGEPGYRVLELETGAERPLPVDASIGTLHRLVPSPAGDRIAAHGRGERRGLWTVDLDGGEARLLVEGDYYPNDWSPDGRSIIAFGLDEPGQLYRVPTAGGEPERWRRLELGDARAICELRADGETLVCGVIRQTSTLGFAELARPLP